MTHFLARRSLFSGVLALCLLAGCQPDADETTAPRPDVAISRPIQRRVTGRDKFTGRFQARESVEIRPRVSGYIDSVDFKDGEAVQKGQLLFVIDPRPYQASVTEAQGRLDDARGRLMLGDVEFDRARRLVGSGAVAQSTYDQRQQALQAAKAAVMQGEGALVRAQLDLNFTQVRAPMDGHVSRHLVSAGNLVAAGSTLLTTIVSTDPIDVYFDIDEESYLRYGKLVQSKQRGSIGGLGSSVEIFLPGDRKPSHKGVLDFTDNRFDPSTGTLRLRARVPNPDGSLTPGQFADITMESEPPHEALLVPDAVVISDPSGKTVAVVDSDSKVAVRQVVLGRLFGIYREVRSGLSADERIILSGLQRVRVGARVTSHPAEFDATDIASQETRP